MWNKAIKGALFAVLLAVLLLGAGRIALLDTGTANAAEKHQPIPRFVSLRADEVNLRTGPGLRYPIEWVYRRKGFPVEIIARYDHWRQVRDWQGTTGWIIEELLVDTRTVIVKGRQHILRDEADASSPALAKLDPGVIARLLECSGQWCEIEARNITGWVTRDAIWGVYPAEKVGR